MGNYILKTKKKCQNPLPNQPDPLPRVSREVPASPPPSQRLPRPKLLRPQEVLPRLKLLKPPSQRLPRRLPRNQSPRRLLEARRLPGARKVARPPEAEAKNNKF